MVIGEEVVAGDKRNVDLQPTPIYGSLDVMTSLAGATNDTLTCAFPATAVTLVGAPGTVAEIVCGAKIIPTNKSKRWGILN